MLIPKLLLNIVPEAKIRKHPLHVSQLATPHKLRYLPRQRKEARPHRLHQKQSLFPGQFAENLALLRIDSDGFFHKHMFAGVEYESSVLVVVAVRRGYVYDVYILGFDELAVGTICFCG